MGCRVMQCARFSWVIIEPSYIISINFVHESISNQSSIHQICLIEITNLSSKQTPIDQICLRTEASRVKINTQKLMPLRGHKNCLLCKHLQQLRGHLTHTIDLFLSYVLISFLLCSCVFGTKGGGIVMY